MGVWDESDRDDKGLNQGNCREDGNGQTVCECSLQAGTLGFFQLVLMKTSTGFFYVEIIAASIGSIVLALLGKKKNL